jgi:subtilisin family serine protease
MAALRIGIVDTGVNPWHSHVRGQVAGCRIAVGPDGTLYEDDDFRDPVGHGTAVAGVIREAFPDAEIFAVRVFDDANTTFPSLVARGILRAAAAGCDFVNVSVAVPPGAGEAVLRDACATAIAAGCVIVASTRGDQAGWLPASLPGVYAVTADDSLASGEIREAGPRRLIAAGKPRDLERIGERGNLRGPSFACARALVHLAHRPQTTARESGCGDLQTK